MNLSAIIDAMVKAGCSPEQLAEVVRAHEGERERAASERRTKDAERQRRHRMSRAVTVTECDQRDGFSPGMVPLSPDTPSHPLNPPFPRVSVDARDDFERFRKAYPRRSGPWKPAKEKFVRLVKAGEDPEEIIRGAEQFAKLKSDSDPQFIPMPATWLNQERWKDPAETQSPRPINVRQFAKADDGKAKFRDALARFRGEVPDAAEPYEGAIDGDFKVVGGD